MESKSSLPKVTKNPKSWRGVRFGPDVTDRLAESMRQWLEKYKRRELPAQIQYMELFGGNGDYEDCGPSMEALNAAAPDLFVVLVDLVFHDISTAVHEGKGRPYCAQLERAIDVLWGLDPEHPLFAMGSFGRQ